jgi:hypothetical protein
VHRAAKCVRGIKLIRETMPDIAVVFSRPRSVFHLGDGTCARILIASSPVLYNSLRCKMEGGRVNVHDELEYFFKEARQ